MIEVKATWLTLEFFFFIPLGTLRSMRKRWKFGLLSLTRSGVLCSPEAELSPQGPSQRVLEESALTPLLHGYHRPSHLSLQEPRKI